MSETPTPEQTSERIAVGAISGAFGVHGEIRVKSFCADPEAIGDYNPLYSEDGKRQFELGLIGAIKDGFSVRITGIENKEDADALKGITLFADRAKLPSLPDDEFYYADLTGLEVFDTGGKKLGTVHLVVNNGAGDMLEIHSPSLSNTVLLPFTKRDVPTVDLTAGRIIADPPEGLFE
jgi:16S rRNA processing protein RimM